MSTSRKNTYHQRHLNRKIRRYLELTKKDDLLPKGGCCNGYAILFLCAFWLNTLPAENPNQHRDSLTWFMKIRQFLVKWDGELDSLLRILKIDINTYLSLDAALDSSEFIRDIDQFINHIIFFQSQISLDHLKQYDLEEQIQFTSKASPKRIYSIAGYFNEDELLQELTYTMQGEERKSTLIELVAQPNTYVLINSYEHAAAIVNYKDSYIYFDANQDTNFPNTYSKGDIDCLVDEILSFHAENDDARNKICFLVYQFEQTGLVYPDPALILAQYTTEQHLTSDALFMSMEMSCTESARFYLSHGMLPDVRTSSRTIPLIYCVRSNHYMLDEIISATRAIDVPDKKGRTALFWALKNDQVVIAKKLLMAGAQISSSIDENQLHELVLSKQYEAAELLLENGYPPDQRDSHDVTPLEVAAKNFDEEMIYLLIQHNADLNMCFSTEETVLHIAVQRRDLNMVSILCENGADPFSKDAADRYPIDYVNNDEHPTIYQILHNEMFPNNLRISFFNKRSYSEIEQINSPPVGDEVEVVPSPSKLIKTQ